MNGLIPNPVSHPAHFLAQPLGGFLVYLPAPAYHNQYITFPRFWGDRAAPHVFQATVDFNHSKPTFKPVNDSSCHSSHLSVMISSIWPSVLKTMVPFKSVR